MTIKYLFFGPCIVICMVLLAFGYFNLRDYTRDQVEGPIRTQIVDCERAKLDRIDITRALTVIEKLLASRIADPTTSSGELERALRTKGQIAATVDGLRGRLFLCEPLIRDDRRSIDKRAVREGGA